MHDFTCPKCSAPLHEDDFNLKLGVAKCQHCSAWSPIALPEGAAEESPRARNKNVPIPAKFQIEENYDELTISWKWFTWGILVLIPFCIAWNSFLIFWYSTALGFDVGEGAPSLIFIIFPIGHVAVGVGLTYTLFAFLFNSSTLSVRRSLLSVKHGPIPWRGQHEISTLDIKQLYCTEKITHNDNSTTSRYHVHVLLRDGRDLKLLSGLTELQEALYLEHKIETHLGIEDEPVAGEVT